MGPGWYVNRLGCALEACDTFVRMRDAAGASGEVDVTLVLFENSAAVVAQREALHAEMTAAAWRLG